MSKGRDFGFGLWGEVVDAGKSLSNIPTPAYSRCTARASKCSRFLATAERAPPCKTVTARRLTNKCRPFTVSLVSTHSWGKCPSCELPVFFSLAENFFFFLSPFLHARTRRTHSNISRFNNVMNGLARLSDNFGDADIWMGIWIHGTKYKLLAIHNRTYTNCVQCLIIYFASINKSTVQISSVAFGWIRTGCINISHWALH